MIPDMNFGEWLLGGSDATPTHYYLKIFAFKEDNIIAYTHNDFQF